MAYFNRLSYHACMPANETAVASAIDRIINHTGITDSIDGYVVLLDITSLSHLIGLSRGTPIAKIRRLGELDYEIMLRQKYKTPTQDELDSALKRVIDPNVRAASDRAAFRMLNTS